MNRCKQKCSAGNRSAVQPRTRNVAVSFATALVLMVLSVFANRANAQSVTPCSTQVNVANYGVDGDMYANHPGGLLPAGIHDDWFENQTLYPGPGIGVIGTTAATSRPPGLSATDFKALRLLPVGSSRNFTYQQRAAWTADGVTLIQYRPVTANSGYLLLDAVAARDNHTAGSAVDSSVFTSGSDKNGANPKTWSVGIGGVQQKNDLIDVGGHIRREYSLGNNLQDPSDDVGGDLWGFGYATTRNTSGDAHTDFEIFRDSAKVVGGGILYTGADSGHTAGRLLPTGAVSKPGDLLVSVDYANGGTNPQASIRIWVNPNDLTGDGTGFDTTDYNNLPNASKVFEFTGVFDGGTNSGPYGYAEIRAVPPAVPLPPGACAGLFYAVVNSTPQLGTPWGNLTAQNAAYSDNMEPLVNVSIAINFSKFGLDIDPISGPCFNLFGTLLIKTRSSGSFTSEMKDFAGPFIFGNFTEVNADAGQDKNLACNVTSVTLDGSSQTPGASYSWSVVPGSGGHIVSGANTCCPVVDSAGCYVLTVTNPALAACEARDTVCVVGTPDTTPPALTCPPAITRHCLLDVPACPTTLAQFEAYGGTATDPSGPLTFSCSDGPLVGGECGGTITRTFTVTDACNNTSTCTQIITVNDEIPPIITGPGDLTLGCNPVIPAADTALATATDNCPHVTKSVLPDVITGDCQKTLTRTYVATDDCNNSAQWIQTITYTVDTQAPVITATGAALALGCNPTAAQIEAALGTATATDNCGNVTPTAADGQVVVNGCFREQTRTWNVSDACGNPAAPVTRTATWKVDTQAPVITASGSIANNGDLGCNPTAAAIDAALGTATATDNCDAVTPTSADGQVVVNGCYRSQTRTWNVSDECGNPAIAVSRTINWKVDTQAPVITATGSVANNSDLGCNPTAAAIDAALGSATATDNCDAVTPTAVDGAVVVNGCNRSQTRTWNVSDACGNPATAVTRTITWKVDTQAPVITATGSVANNSDLGCNPTSNAINDALGTATATDNCGNVTPTPVDGAVVVNGCFRSQTRTWNVSDLCGNPALAVSRTITWKVDTQAPVITATGTTLSLGCNPNASQIEAALGTATATDNCDQVTPTSVDGAVVVNGCNRSQTRTWNVSDACGNPAAAVTRTVTWKVDTQAPVITATGSTANNANLGCNPVAKDIEDALGTATATDNCDVVTPTFVDGAVVVNGCFRSQTRTWNVSDLCGNPATPVTRTINWKVDTQAPVITATGSVANNTNLGCNPTASAIDSALGTATATDNCDQVTPTYTDGAVVVSGCNRSQTRTWNVSDLCGNPAQAVSRTITWKVDTQAPVITATGTTLPTCNPTAAQIDAALGTATATDNCDQVTPIAVDGPVVINGCGRSQTRTWNVSDACGNAAIAVSRTVSWSSNTTPPVITATGSVANNSNIGCNPTAAAIDAALGTATATDDCGPVTPTAADGAVVVNGCLRTQTRTWTVNDACGNPATPVSRTISWKVDTQAPVITATGSVANNANLGCNPVAKDIEDALGTATATDNCDVVSPTFTDGAVVVNGCNRSQTRTWNVSDLCGNPAIAVSRTINWKVDTQAPVITATGSTANNANLGCNPTAAAINAALGTATATDNCDVVSPTFTDGAVVVNGCNRSQTRTWNVSDLCGNPAIAVSRTINWKVDTQAPVITATGSTANNGNLGCNPTAAQIDAALGTATVTDNCDQLVSIPVDGAVVVNGCNRSQTRTWNVTDACGNPAVAVSRTISWKVDTQAPVITATGSVANNANLGCNPVAKDIEDALGTATATDNCDVVSPTFTDGAVVVNGCNRSQTRTWNVSDLCGNPAIAVSRTINWKVDTQAPVITATGSTANNANLGCNPTAAAINAALGTATATDNCDAVTPTSVDGAVVVNGCNRSQTRTWNVTDACGNPAVAVSRTISWKVDTQAPVITATGSIANNGNLGCNPTAAQIDAALGTATATDNCDQVTPTATNSTVTVNGCMRTQTRTWNVTDACGNPATPVSRTISWKVDTTPPVVTCNAGGNITVCAGTPISIRPTATDNCDGPITPNCSRSDGLALTAAYPVGVTTVTCSATDACGNSATCSITVTVVANPTCAITPPANLPVSGSTGNTITSTSTNATSYQWSLVGTDPLGTPWVITAGANSPTVTYTAGTGIGAFKLVVTNTVNGVACKDSCEIMVQSIRSRYCTYTQGAYGNAGGMHCSGVTTPGFLTQLLSTPLVVGGLGTTNKLTLTAADVANGCFFTRLPGGGASVKLLGTATCSNPVGIVLNGTKFKNTLLNQTITLGLNLRIPGSTLSDLRLTGRYLTTYNATGVACSNTGLAIPGSGQVFTIPASVINYLGANNKISDLYYLANRALAGLYTGTNPSLSQIASAVDAINRAFDNCRILGGFSNTAPTTYRDGSVEEEMEFDLFSVKAYPNPFTQKASIDFMLKGFDSNVTLEVYNLTGMKVATLFEGFAEGDKKYSFEFDGESLTPGIYIYHLNTGDAVYTDKLILIKQ